MSGLISLLNSSSSRAKTKETYVAPYHLRNKVVYSVEYPDGVFINGTGKIDERVGFIQPYMEDIDDAVEEDCGSDWEDCDEYSVAPYHHHFEEEEEEDGKDMDIEDDKELEDLIENSITINERVDIENTTRSQNQKIFHYIEFCENLLSKVRKAFRKESFRVLLACHESKRQQDIKVIRKETQNKKQDKNICELSLRLHSDFSVRVKCKTTNQILDELDQDAIVEHIQQLNNNDK